MSSGPTDILNAIETRTNAVLPSYSRLKHSYNLEANEKRGSNDGYAIGAGAGSTVAGTFRTVTFDQEFFVVLTKRFGGRSGDSADRTALKAIYDDIELLYKDFFQSKLGINSIVYVVSEMTLEEPELLGDNVISVRMNFTVKFRKDT